MNTVKLVFKSLAKLKATPLQATWALPQNKRSPAVLALYIQIVALLLNGLLLAAYLSINPKHQPYFASWLQGNHSTFSYCLIAMQSLLSVKLARVAGMPSWWQWIHGLFPITITVMRQIPIPNTVYLIAFLITLTIFWSVHRTRVPFYPSFPATWHAILAVIRRQFKQNKSLNVIDIGSGIGDLPLFLARHRPQDTVSGIEIAPLPFMISKLRAWLTRSNINLTLGDYQQCNLSQYDVVFVYLSTAAMPALWKKAKQEMRQGTVLISSEFTVPHIIADQTIKPNKSSPSLYIYQF